MRICDVNGLYSGSGGGIRTYHRNKEAWLGRSGHDYAFIHPSDTPGERVDGTTVHLALRGIPVPFSGHYRLTFNPPGLLAFIRRFAPDIIEVGSPYLEPLIVKRLLGRIPVAGFWHAHYPAAYIGHAMRRFGRFAGRTAEKAAWAYARATYGAFDAVFASSRWVVRDLERHGIRRVIELPLGVDTALFSPDKRDEALRARLGASEKRPLFLFPHRLQEEKGLYTLLEAVKLILKELDAVFVFAGLGPGRRKVLEAAAECPAIRYVSYVSDPATLAGYIASADAVFALSPFETFGLSAAESLSCGTPVIGADEGGTAELILKSGGGLVVSPRNPRAVAETAMRLVDGGMKNRAGEAGRAYAVKWFSWDGVFERQLSCYRYIIDAFLGGKRMEPAPVTWDPSTRRMEPV